MAVVRSMAKGSQEIKPHTSEVDCYYQVVLDDSGNTRLHLTTFGSDHRRSQPKSSQSLQLSEQAAKELVEIIKSAFPGVS